MRKNYPVGIIAFFTIAFLAFLSYNYFNSSTDAGPMLLSFNEKEEGGAAKQEELFARMEHERLMTMDPALGYVPTERLLIAEEKTKEIMSAMKENSPQALLTWTERGPNNLGGRTRAVLINKSDATGNTVFAGSVSGGLWKTTNFKSVTPTWTQISSFSSNLAISCLAQDPSNLNIMYAGTGEGVGNADAIRGLGLYKSTDGGTTWTRMTGSLPSGAATNVVTLTDFYYVNDIAVYSNGAIYVATSSGFCNRGGILRSTNGGTSWTRVIGIWDTPYSSCNTATSFQGYDLEISKDGDIYATAMNYLGGLNGRIYKSPAGPNVGDSLTWTNITPAPKPGGDWQRIDVACAPNNNNILYAIFQGTGNGIDSIMRSDNAGTSWVNADVTTNWCDQGSSTSLDFSRGQAWYDLIIAVKPDDAATAFAGGVDIMKTTNSGGAWAQISQWNSGCASLPYVHADIHNIAYFPTGLGTTDEFIVVCDGGIFYSSDNGTTFTNKSAGYNTIQYYGAAIHPTAGSNYMLAGAQDNGSHKFTAAGLGAITTATGGDGTLCFIDTDDPNIQLTSTPFANWYYSRDGGGTFAGIGYGNSVGRFVNPYDWDNTTNQLYTTYNARQIRRVFNIASGSPADSPTPLTIASTTNYMASAIKVDPNTPNRVWVAFSTRPGSASQYPELYYVDGADNFPTATVTGVNEPAALTSGTAGAYISSLDIEPGNANHILITVSNYGMNSVWESTDLGANWASIEGNLPDMPVRWGVFVPSGFDPGSGVNSVGGVLLATELGVWSTKTLAGGSTVWVQNGGTMGNVRVDMVKIRNSDKTVVAATHGRGLFTTALISLPVNFTAFTGKAEEKQNRLMWSVENEVDNKGYEVQRKYKNETGFAKIGFVPAKSANARANDYTFPDVLVDLGIDNVSYRLKQIDIDGNFKYSSIITLNRKISAKFVEYISVRSNSMLIRINGQSNQPLNFRLFDNSGRLVQQKQLQFRTQEVSLAGLPHGVFVVELSAAEGRRFSQKIAY